MATLILLNDKTEKQIRIDGITDDQVDYASKNAWRYAMGDGSNGWMIPILDSPPSRVAEPTPGTVTSPNQP